MIIETKRKEKDGTAYKKKIKQEEEDDEDRELQSRPKKNTRST